MVMSKDTLIKSAYQQDVVANNEKDVYYGDDLGAPQSMAFVIANGDVGDDFFKNFGRDDSIITGKKIFDGNDDGIIGFGRNGLLDVDRVNSKKAGNDQLSLSNGNQKVTELRYLGEMNGQHAYADSQTLRGFSDLFSSKTESKIGADTFEGGTILYDNQLGLNLGDDMILSRAGLKIVTTVKLRDDDNDGIIMGETFASEDDDGHFYTKIEIGSKSYGDPDCATITVIGSGGSLYFDGTMTDPTSGQVYYMYGYGTD